MTKCQGASAAMRSAASVAMRLKELAAASLGPWKSAAPTWCPPVFGHVSDQERPQNGPKSSKSRHLRPAAAFF